MKIPHSCILFAVIACCVMAVTSPAHAQGYLVAVPEGSNDDAAWREVGTAIAKHRHAQHIVSIREKSSDDLSQALKKHAPDSLAIVVPPEWIDDNFVGEVFSIVQRVDGDAALDCAYGFITGKTPGEALRMVERTIAAEANRDALPKKFVGIGHTFAAADLGPFATEQAAMHQAYGYETAAIIGVDDSDQWNASKADEITKLNGASLVYCAGHGMGDWFCAIDGELLRDLTLESAIIVNGSCHSATTLQRHDIDAKTMGVVAKTIDAEDSIALNFISAGAIGQLASTASSSWMNVALAIDGFFLEGQSMGDALKDRLNTHIEQNALGQAPIIAFIEGEPSPQFLGPEENPAGIQSISRVILLGDPAYVPFPEPRPRVAVNLPQAQTRGPARHPAQPAPRRPAVQDRGKTTAELIAELDDPNAPLLLALNELIGRGGAVVEPLLAELPDNPNWQIAKVLGAIGDTRAIDPLIRKLADDPPSPMREVVVEALELITGEVHGENIEAWRKWRDATH